MRSLPTTRSRRPTWSGFAACWPARILRPTRRVSPSRYRAICRRDSKLPGRPPVRSATRTIAACGGSRNTRPPGNRWSRKVRMSIRSANAATRPVTDCRADSRRCARARRRSTSAARAATALPGATLPIRAAHGSLRPCQRQLHGLPRPREQPGVRLPNLLGQGGTRDQKMKRRNTVTAGDWLVFRPIAGRKTCLSAFLLSFLLAYGAAPALLAAAEEPQSNPWLSSLNDGYRHALSDHKPLLIRVAQSGVPPAGRWTSRSSRPTCRRNCAVDARRAGSRRIFGRR